MLLPAYSLGISSLGLRIPQYFWGIVQDVEMVVFRLPCLQGLVLTTLGNIASIWHVNGLFAHEGRNIFSSDFGSLPQKHNRPQRGVRTSPGVLPD